MKMSFNRIRAKTGDLGNSDVALTSLNLEFFPKNSIENDLCYLSIQDCVS